MTCPTKGSYVLAMSGLFTETPSHSPPSLTLDNQCRRASLLALVAENATALQTDVPITLLSDKSFILEAARTNPASLLYAPPEFTGNRAFLLEAVAATGGRAFKYTTEKQRENYWLVRDAIDQSQGYALKFASIQLRSDEVFVKRAVALGDGRALRYAARDLRQNRTFVLECLSLNPDCIRYIEEEFYNDREMNFYSLRAAAKREESQLRAEKAERRAAKAKAQAMGLSFLPGEAEESHSTKISEFDPSRSRRIGKPKELRPVSLVHVGCLPQRMWPAKPLKRTVTKKESRYVDPREVAWWKALETAAEEVKASSKPHKEKGRSRVDGSSDNARVQLALRSKERQGHPPRRRLTIKGAF